MIHEHARELATALCDVLERPGGVRPHFQPIVDLKHGEVCGYEALARFTGRPGLSPAEIFVAADLHGLGGRLEALMVREVLAARPGIARDRFVSVNVSPRAMLTDEVQEAFREVGRLDGVIVEITEQTDTDLDELDDALDILRVQGAAIAVDDAGSGYASLRRITALSPRFVKVDRSLVTDIDRDPTKAAVVETLCQLAHRVDAWIVAEGIERTGELDELIRLRVPLGQGFAFGRPAPGLAEVEPDVTAHIRATYRPESAEPAVGPLIEAIPTLPEPASRREVAVLFDRLPTPEFVALVDPAGRPSGLVRRADYERGDGPVRTLMLVTPDMPLASVTRRAMARPAERRFDPLVCWDDAGRYAGVVRIERVMDVLAGAA